MTDGGIATCCSEVHSKKASRPIDVTDPGIATFVKEMHEPKAVYSISVTEGGIGTSTSAEQLKKAEA